MKRTIKLDINGKKSEILRLVKHEEDTSTWIKYKGHDLRVIEIDTDKHIYSVTIEGEL